MTGRALLYASFLLVLYLTINYSGNRFLMVFWFFLCLIPLLSLISALFSRRMLRLRLRARSPQVDRGDSLPVELRVNNSSLLPLSRLVLELSLEGLPEGSIGERIRLRMAPRHEERIRLDYRFSHRGVYDIRITGGRVQDGFGFFRLPLSKKALGEALRIDVWPRRLALHTTAGSNIAELEEELSRSTKISQELDEIARLREYQPGDKLKLVHWSVSARMQALQVREFEEPRDIEAAIVLADALPAGRDGRLLADAAAEVALSLAARSLREELPTRLIITGINKRDPGFSLLAHRREELDFLASALAKQLPEEEILQLEAIYNIRSIDRPYTNPALEAALHNELPAITKVLYLIAFTIDEALISLLTQLMKQCSNLYLLWIQGESTRDQATVPEALTRLNIRLLRFDSTAFHIGDDDGAT